MSFTTTFTTSIRRGSTTLTDTRSFITSAIYEVSEAIADGDELPLAIEIDISQMSVFAMVSDQDMVITTNAVPPGGDDTLTLTAGEMLFWRTGDPAIFTADVTAMYMDYTAPGAGVSAALQIIVGLDPTV